MENLDRLELVNVWKKLKRQEREREETFMAITFFDLIQPIVKNLRKLNCFSFLCIKLRFQSYSFNF